MALCPVRLDCSKIMYGMSVLVWFASPYFLHATGIWAKYTIRDLAENVNVRPCLDQSDCSYCNFVSRGFEGMYICIVDSIYSITSGSLCILLLCICKAWKYPMVIGCHGNKIFNCFIVLDGEHGVLHAHLISSLHMCLHVLLYCVAQCVTMT